MLPEEKGNKEELTTCTGCGLIHLVNLVFCPSCGEPNKRRGPGYRRTIIGGSPKKREG
uniref:Uncharacterized protein n=1 Tax=viral metagenome TaxID=1070528 RepID=A0A6M3KDV2_9ZZZZ